MTEVLHLDITVAVHPDTATAAEAPLMEEARLMEEAAEAVQAIQEDPHQVEDIAEVHQEVTDVNIQRI